MRLLPPLARRALVPALGLLALAGCQPQAPGPPTAAASTPPATVSEPTPLPVPSTSLPTPPQPTPAPPSPSAAASNPLLASLRAGEWSRLPTSRPIVALTFDAGAGAQGIPSILATLNREHVPGTFFLTGRWVQSYPALAREIAANQAHSIANHTWSHPQLPTLPDALVTGQVIDAENIILSTTGRQPRPLFRFPYGSEDARTMADVQRLGYGSIRWTIDTQGWKGAAGGQSVDLVVGRVMANLGPGEIVLMHVGAADDGSTLDADALPRIISEIRARGYGFVAIWDFIFAHA